MRLRHSQFRIREEDAAVWLKYMRESLDEVFAAFPVEREIIWKELQSQVCKLFTSLFANKCRQSSLPIPEKMVVEFMDHLTH